MFALLVGFVGGNMIMVGLGILPIHDAYVACLNVAAFAFILHLFQKRESGK